VTAQVAILVPVVKRPHHAEPFMASLRRSALPNAWAVYPICDRGDTAAIDAWTAHAGAVLLGDFPTWPGTFAEKVNFGYRSTAEPWLFLVGSDVVFQPGWLAAALAVAEQTGARVVGTNDRGNSAVMAGEHATHMLIGRDYVDTEGASWDGPGVVCHEGYSHCYVDNEIVAVAKQRGTWASARDSVVEHLHPAFGKAAPDDVYELGDRNRIFDGGTFRHREMVYMAGPNLDPHVVAGVPLGDTAGGNTDQLASVGQEAVGGMSTENSGALTGSAGLATAKKAPAKKATGR